MENNLFRFINITENKIRIYGKVNGIAMKTFNGEESYYYFNIRFTKNNTLFTIDNYNNKKKTITDKERLKELLTTIYYNH